MSNRQPLETGSDITYKMIMPGKHLGDFVESFWILYNPTDKHKEVVVLPDGRIDLFFSYSADEPYHAVLLGIETTPGHAVISPKRLTFAISFKPLAAEYIFRKPLAHLLNKAELLPLDFWNFSKEDLNDFDTFCHKAELKITHLIPKEIDQRKRRLFYILYKCKGSKTVKELSEEVHWSSRQINRYFTAQFGLSLKEYCTILRFRASFEHIKQGKLFPQENFSDQSHFIREVKKRSGVSPKELKQNKNDRFVQFSTLDTE